MNDSAKDANGCSHGSWFGGSSSGSLSILHRLHNRDLHHLRGEENLEVLLVRLLHPRNLWVSI